MKQMPIIPGLEIEEKLGEGGQGEVFRVKQDGRACALKLYSESSSTPEQRSIISFQIQEGNPAAGCADKFAWPEKIIDLPEKKRFGYTMPLIDTGKFITLGDIKSGRVAHPGYGIMAEVGRQLAECFRELHIAGYCYRDISENNFYLSPDSGDVIICDNDNVMIDKHELGNIIGTMQFVAPEVILGQERPSTVTDQHSLACLLFLMMCGGHPLNGMNEYNVRVYDAVAAQHLYGHNPIFVFDPKDRSNALPDARGYRHVAAHWAVLPRQMKELFVKAFTIGLKNPAKRVTEIEWKHAFSQLLGQRHVCGCGAENFWDPARRDQICWHRQCRLGFPPKLYAEGTSVSALLVKPGQILTSMHLGEKSSSSVVAVIEKHPSDSTLCLLRNKTAKTWSAEYDTQRIDVPPQKAIPLHPGIRINIANHKISVHP